MAFDYFLRIDGIAGESADSKHKGEIAVQSFSWGESNSGPAPGGGGGGAGKVNIRDLYFTAHTSKASPQLMLACATGQHFKAAQLTARKAGKAKARLPHVLAPGRAGHDLRGWGKRGGRAAGFRVAELRPDRSRVQRAEGGRLARCVHQGRLGRQGQQEALTLYDAVPYAGHPFAQTHPDRLATLATLFGLKPAAPGRCRVLELGCGDAGNLAPMALALPETQFVGIDAAPGAIARGRALADAVGLPNLTLETVAIEDFEPDAGGFDYVIAHGVYSWLPAPARDRLLALCARALARSGVAYVSYNALPGGRLREALRDVLRFHTAEFEDPTERVGQARGAAAVPS